MDVDLVQPVSASSATVTISGTYNATLVSYPLQVDSITPTHISTLEELLPRFHSYTLGGLNAMLSPARSIIILDFGKYSCLCEMSIIIDISQWTIVIMDNALSPLNIFHPLVHMCVHRCV